MSPLDRSPMYATPESGGAAVTTYWRTKTQQNGTLYESRMRQQTATVNTVFDYGAPFHLLVRDRWPGASLAVFDVHRLLADIMADPGKYLDDPADAQGWYYHCVLHPDDKENPKHCTKSENPLSSYLW